MKPQITVIIPTTCESGRRDQLLRAIDSIQRQEGVEPQVLLAVNGSRFDQDLLESLRQRQDLVVAYQEAGSAPKACAYARSLVSTGYFSFLDDDDALLPQSLAIRVEPMEADSTIDLSVGNGYNEFDGKREMRVKHASSVNNDPLGSMIDGNWLTSCGGVFRSSTVGQEFFANPAAYNEWTLLAFRVASRRRVVFIDKPTFVVYSTPGSLSKSFPFMLSDADVIREMLSICERKDVRQRLKRKLSASLHNIADHLRSDGQVALAWKYHLESLFLPGGMRNLTFTRKLLFPALY